MLELSDHFIRQWSEPLGEQSQNDSSFTSEMAFAVAFLAESIGCSFDDLLHTRMNVLDGLSEGFDGQVPSLHQVLYHELKCSQSRGFFRGDRRKELAPGGQLLQEIAVPYVLKQAVYDLNQSPDVQNLIGCLGEVSEQKLELRQMGPEGLEHIGGPLE